jgi:hypothetical protein
MVCDIGLDRIVCVDAEGVTLVIGLFDARLFFDCPA